MLAAFLFLLEPIAYLHLSHVTHIQPSIGVQAIFATALTAYASNLVQDREGAIAPPPEWQSHPLSPGVTAYLAPPDQQLTFTPEAENFLIANATPQNPLDGTRFPYVSEISITDLLAHPIAPGQYQWTTEWKGEGYDREWVRSPNHPPHWIAHREGGENIEVNVVYDETVTDSHQSNLQISILSHQAQTAQTTDLSAFWIDPTTGEELKVQDFAQLSPTYNITFTQNGGFAGTQIAVLEPCGQVSFSMYIDPQHLAQVFPLRLQGENRGFAERELALYELMQQGWVVREVPGA